MTRVGKPAMHWLDVSAPAPARQVFAKLRHSRVPRPELRDFEAVKEAWRLAFADASLPKECISNDTTDAKLSAVWPPLSAHEANFQFDERELPRCPSAALPA